ncbi:GATA-type zinc finger protein 1 isoform X2 [Ochotona princeps]|uniref:GATA-type zinc finger protein 1 isoform X2 n=1 Tax=Ochotona princeps TaxID=9978 RepID=UPI0027150F27|nr:GATA-type zinc finger protein 1 isoform X2 [Ochotona princeps]
MVETRAPPRQARRDLEVVLGRGLCVRACEEEGLGAWYSRAAGPTQPDRIRSRLGLELLAPTCLDPEPAPGPPPRQEQMTPAYLQPRLHLWRVCQDPITALDEHQERPPAQHRPGWEPMALESTDTPPLVRQRCQGLEPPKAPALALRRPRKQPHPRKGMEEADPRFQGVTLNFEIKSDASLQIVPSYSGLAHVGGGGSSSSSSGSHAQEPPPAPAAAPEVNSPGPSEALGPRRCASCGTQRTPLWRDAEDGTPLCNACGIRYKKYGTRCSSCWLVPRKTVQVRRLCGRCGISWGSRSGPTE